MRNATTAMTTMAIRGGVKSTGNLEGNPWRMTCSCETEGEDVAVWVLALTSKSAAAVAAQEEERP